LNDLSTSILFNDDDIGKNIAETLVFRLSEINKDVRVQIHKEWFPPSTRPKPSSFDINDPLHVTYVLTAASLIAQAVDSMQVRDTRYGYRR
jgi:molybdopterin/thiamine biosynthesis adenylyltransferase